MSRRKITADGWHIFAVFSKLRAFDFCAVTQFCDRESAHHRPIDFYAHVGDFPEGYRVCVTTRQRALQGLKPVSFQAAYVTAEAVTHKDFLVLT